MTTFAELVQSVYDITKRPDLSAETTLALKRAIKKEHAAMDYKADLMKTSAIPLSQPSPNNYRYSLSLSTLGLTATLRKIKLMQESISPAEDVYNTQNTIYGILQFPERDVENLFDGYGNEYKNYYYLIGTNLSIVAPRQVDNVVMYYYQTPDVTNTGAYSDWMADMYDYVIYTHAAAEIFRIIGKSDEHKMMLDNLRENRLDIIKSQITGAG